MPFKLTYDTANSHHIKSTESRHASINYVNMLKGYIVSIPLSII